MSPPVERVLESYFHNHLVLGKTIDRRRQETIMLHLLEHLGKKTAKELTPKALAEYAKARGVHQNTIRREITTLRAAYRVAFRAGDIEAGDLPNLDIPEEIKPPERWLRVPELQALREAADEGLRDFIDVAYYTGGRKASVTRLTQAQIDLDAKRINLALPGERQRNKKRPVVPIFPEIKEVIERRYANATRGRLFTDMASVNRRFKQAVQKAGLLGRVSPHTLRHSRATHLLQAGAPIWSVAKLLGDTVTTVEQVYGHHCPDFLEETLSPQRANS